MANMKKCLICLRIFNLHGGSSIAINRLYLFVSVCYNANSTMELAGEYAVEPVAKIHITNSEEIMTEKEISEIRRRVRREKSNISHILGCYVNERREIISMFDQSLGLMPQEEQERYLAILKKTLSGTAGKNLIDISFRTQQVMDSEEHKLLMSLRKSSLKDESAVQDFFQRVIQSLNFEGNYLILLAHDNYDVPYRSKDGEKQQDASSEVFSYILCSICPVKLTQPELSYYAAEKEFHNSNAGWVVATPELGFMFPAFDDRAANIYNALYYTKDIAENHGEFIDAVFHTDVPMPAAEQKATFQSVLSNALESDCSFEVIQTVHEELCGMIELHKESKVDESLVISKKQVASVLQSCGVSEAHVDTFAEKYDAEFGEDSAVSPRNIIDSKKFEIRTPDVVITVNPERSDLVETRVINGTKYILICADEGVEVNGVSIHISDKQ